VSIKAAVGDKEPTATTLSYCYLTDQKVVTVIIQQLQRLKLIKRRNFRFPVSQSSAKLLVGSDGKMKHILIVCSFSNTSAKIIKIG